MGGRQGRSRTSQVGSDRAGFPEAPRPTPLPPGCGISGVRAEGQPRPLLPSGSGIPPTKGGGPASASVQVGSHWTRNCSSSLAPPPPPKPRGWPPSPSLPFPLPGWHRVCQELAENKPAGVGLQERGNLDTVAAVANGRHTLRLFWGDCCRC